MLSNKLKWCLIIPVFFLVFLPIASKAQKPDFDMEILAAKQTIDELTYTGYQTRFDMPVEELQKLWWKYSKGIGIVENMKSHYIIRVPSSKKGMSPVSLIEKTSEGDDGSTVFLAVLDQTNNQFKAQIKDVLLAFKLQYYVKQIQAQISQKEDQLAKVSNDYMAFVSAAQKNGATPDTRKSKQSLDRITRLSYELESLKRSLTQLQ